MSSHSWNERNITIPIISNLFVPMEGSSIRVDSARENQQFFRGKIHSWELEGSIETCLSFLRIATDFCIDFTVIDLFLSQQAGEPTRIVFEISHNRVEYFFESRAYSLQANRISFSDKFG